MSATYTAAPITLAAGDAVTLIEPVDMDDLTAASNNTQEHLADLLKTLINLVPLFGLSPGGTAAAIDANGLLLELPMVAGQKVRLYSMPLLSGTVSVFWLSYNAKFDVGTGLWTYDVAPSGSHLYDSYAVRMFTGGNISVFHHDNALAATWSLSGWDANFRSSGGSGSPNQAGVGILALEAENVFTFSGTWADVGGGNSTHACWKDLQGQCYLKGYVTGGTANQIGSVPQWMAPSENRLFPRRTASSVDCIITVQASTGHILCSIASLGADAVYLDGIVYR